MDKLSPPTSLRGQAVINCEFEYTEHSAIIRVSDIRNNILSVLGFASQTPSTPIGLEIIKSALTAWAIGKFRQALVIKLNFAMDHRSFDFINSLNNNVIGALDDFAPPSIQPKALTELPQNPLITIPNEALIGNSGGRDSFVSSDILSRSGFSLRPFKIDYDQLIPSSDYSTYESDSIIQCSNGNYEPFDIPITYFAALWSIHDRIPKHIAIGHSFDVLGFQSSKRRAPYESPEAMLLHQRYLNEILGDAPQFIFPIATLSTYSVFEYIRRNYGLPELESRVSCWNSNGADCGFCDKCQRIKLASSAMHLPDYDYLPGMPQVIDNHGYLFGNPFYDQLVSQYGIDTLSESQLFADHLPFNERIASHLHRHYSKSYKTLGHQPQAHQPMEFVGDPTQIGKILGINYSQLPTERLNGISKKMPYEQYFKRITPVLASHGEIPKFTPGLGWNFKRLNDGPRLEVPNTPLFRSFFNHAQYE